MDKKLINIMRVLGGIIIVLGMLGIGISIFTAVKCLFMGIMTLAIGLAILWSTETAY